MSNALEFIAREKGLSTSYDNLTKQNSNKTSRAKKRAYEEESDGPPDKHRDFDKGISICLDNHFFLWEICI